MAKFYGIVGYVESVEVERGIWSDKQITEVKYSGDIIRNYSKRDRSDKIIDDISLSNQVSIVADPYAMEHFMHIKYIKFIYPKLGGAWSISDVTVEEPHRLRFTIGGIYNGEQA